MRAGTALHLDRFRPRLLIELTGAHLARTGDTLAAVFGFLEGRGYRAFALDNAGGFMPVAAPRDGDFWFLPVEDPLGAAC